MRPRGLTIGKPSPARSRRKVRGQSGARRTESLACDTSSTSTSSSPCIRHARGARTLAKSVPVGDLQAASDFPRLVGFFLAACTERKHRKIETRNHHCQDCLSLHTDACSQIKFRNDVIYDSSK